MNVFFFKNYDFTHYARYMNIDAKNVCDKMMMMVVMIATIVLIVILLLMHKNTSISTTFKNINFPMKKNENNIITSYRHKEMYGETYTVYRKTLETHRKAFRFP